jgi:16S rRNA (guanine527-N7)-methyltransferase
MKSLLSQALAKNNIQLSDETQQTVLHYLDLMQKWNRVFNLTNITDPREIIYLHVIDSLVMQPYIYGTRLLDVGTGAGLPGMILAITHPHLQWTLLDKNNKKTRFLTQVVAELSLKNVTVVHQRSEDFHPPQGFDMILSRAYGTLRMFLETTEHLLANQGIFVAMKGKYPIDELKEVPERFVLQKADRIEIKGMDIERHVICFTKSS